MKRFVVAALGVALAASMGAIPAGAANQALVASDPAGDVKINNRVDGLSTRTRKSIDILRVVITDGDASTKIMVRVRKLIETHKFVQKFYLDVNLSGSYASYVFYPQAKGESLIYHQFGGGPNDFTMCNEVQPRVRWSEGKVLINVPHSCVPKGAATVHVNSWIQSGTESHRYWAMDAADFNGKLRG